MRQNTVGRAIDMTWPFTVDIRRFEHQNDHSCTERSCGWIVRYEAGTAQPCSRLDWARAPSDSQCNFSSKQTTQLVIASILHRCRPRQCLSTISAALSLRPSAYANDAGIASHALQPRRFDMYTIGYHVRDLEAQPCPERFARRSI